MRAFVDRYHASATLRAWLRELDFAALQTPDQWALQEWPSSPVNFDRPT